MSFEDFFLCLVKVVVQTVHTDLNKISYTLY